VCSFGGFFGRRQANPRISISGQRVTADTHPTDLPTPAIPLQATFSTFHAKQHLCIFFSRLKTSQFKHNSTSHQKNAHSRHNAPKRHTKTRRLAKPGKHTTGAPADCSENRQETADFVRLEAVPAAALPHPYSWRKPMIRQKIFDDISNKVNEVLSQSPAKDIEKNMRAMLQAGFSKLDLVTREEFEVQQEVLTRTREKLRQMELRIGELEKMLAPKTGDETPTGAQD
jgi:BMFP domain-containing protein YqiC